MLGSRLSCTRMGEGNAASGGMYIEQRIATKGRHNSVCGARRDTTRIGKRIGANQLGATPLTRESDRTLHS